MRVVYLLLLCLLAPFYLAAIWLKELRNPEQRGRTRARLGHVAPAAQPTPVWVHAVSVGEFMAALPLIRGLVRQHGPGRVWVTASTPTGYERVRTTLGNEVRHSYAPLDLPQVVRRFVQHVQPQKLVIIETELWPNLLRTVREHGASIVIVNARLSERSMRRYRKFSGLMRSVLGDVKLVAAQSEMDAERFRELGAAQVIAAGNLKFDSEPDAAQVAAGKALREQIGSRPVWIAASTREGEERAALEAHALVLQRLPDALLILVPRHRERFEAVAGELARSGLSSQRRSADAATVETQVLFGDSMGEMWTYLAAADVAFVGGSLAPIGGHNVLEPAALGLPVLFGPNMQNFIAARDALLGANAGRSVADATELAAAITELLSDTAGRRAMGIAAREVIGQNRGALQRVLQLVETL